MKNVFLLVIALIGGLLVASLAVASGVDHHTVLLHGTATMGFVGMAARPSLAEFRANSTTGRGLESFKQSLYDHLLYATAGVAQLNFFATPKGQGKTSAVGAVAASPKTIADTNMELAGQLPSGKGFSIETIEVPFYAGSVSTADTYTLASPALFNATAAAALEAQLADINSFYQSGSLQLFIQSKVILEEAPLMRFPPRASLNLQGSVSAAGTNAQPAGFGFVRGVAAGAAYRLDPRVSIEPSVNFNVALNFPAAIATPSGFNARVGIILDGHMFRAA